MNTRTRYVVVMAAVAMICAWQSAGGAAPQQIDLPKGSVGQKLAPGHVRFLLPDGRVVELRGYNAKAGIIGDCGLFDAAGHKLAGGLQCALRSGPKPVIDPDPPYKPTGFSPAPRNAVQIDDEITWLPAVITFQPSAIVDPQPPGRPAQLSPQPDAPGAVKPGVVHPLQRRAINPQPEPPKPMGR